MEARLVYRANDLVTELEHMDLEALDAYTFINFKNEKAIINDPKYKSKIAYLPDNGEVVITFDGFLMPIDTADKIGNFDIPTFAKEHSLSVLTKDRMIIPSARGFLRNIVGTITDPEVLDEFHEQFRDKFTKKEEFLYCIGLLSDDYESTTAGVKRILTDAYSSTNQYLTMRMYMEGLSKFDSVKNKDVNGNLCAPKFVKK